MLNDDAVPSPIRDLHALFEAELPQVRFGDIDTAALAGATGRVRQLAAAVAELEARCDAARNELAAAKDDLTQLAHRALSHARLYAQHQPLLAAQLDAISLGRPARRPAALPAADGLPRKRGRPPKPRPELKPEA